MPRKTTAAKCFNILRK